MRLVALVALAGCGFEVAAPDNMPIDAADAPDAPDVLPVTWTIDMVSGKVTPQTTAEWTDFLVAKSLNVGVPDGLWLMQEASGPLIDSIGNVDLSVVGTPMYREAVTGWTRLGVKMVDGTGTGFVNTTAAELPDVSTTSMTVMMLYATEMAPPAARVVAILGSTVPANYGALTLQPSGRLMLTVGGTSATGTVDHGPEIAPVIIQLDRRVPVQQVITNRETITPPNTPLLTSRGIFLGTGAGASPSGRWIYMAAWYGPNAEFTAGDAGMLLTALGW